MHGAQGSHVGAQEAVELFDAAPSDGVRAPHEDDARQQPIPTWPASSSQEALFCTSELQRLSKKPRLTRIFRKAKKFKHFEISGLPEWLTQHSPLEEASDRGDALEADFNKLTCPGEQRGKAASSRSSWFRSSFFNSVASVVATLKPDVGGSRGESGLADFAVDAPKWQQQSGEWLGASRFAERHAPLRIREYHLYYGGLLKVRWATGMTTEERSSTSKRYLEAMYLRGKSASSQYAASAERIATASESESSSTDDSADPLSEGEWERPPGEEPYSEDWLLAAADLSPKEDLESTVDAEARGKQPKDRTRRSKRLTSLLGDGLSIRALGRKLRLKAPEKPVRTKKRSLFRKAITLFGVPKLASSAVPDDAVLEIPPALSDTEEAAPDREADERGKSPPPADGLDARACARSIHACIDEIQRMHVSIARAQRNLRADLGVSVPQLNKMISCQKAFLRRVRKLEIQIDDLYQTAQSIGLLMKDNLTRVAYTIRHVREEKHRDGIGKKFLWNLLFLVVIVLAALLWTCLQLRKGVQWLLRAWPWRRSSARLAYVAQRASAQNNNDAPALAVSAPASERPVGQLPSGGSSADPAPSEAGGDGSVSSHPSATSSNPPPFYSGLAPYQLRTLLGISRDVHVLQLQDEKNKQ